DRVTGTIELVRLVEMRAWLDWTFAIIFNAPTPENHASIGILAFELEPNVEGIHGSGREEVADLARPHDHVDARRRAWRKFRAGMVDWRGNLPHFTNHSGGCRFSFLADGKAGHGLWGVAGPPFHLNPFVFDRRDREDIHRDETRLEKIHRRLRLRFVAIGIGDRRVGGRETVRMHHAVMIAGIARGHQRHVAIGADLAFRWVVERPRALPRNTA